MLNKKTFDLLSRVMILVLIVAVLAALKPEAFLTASNLSQVVFQQAPFTMLMSFGISMAIITHGIDISMASVMVLAAYLSATSFQNGNYAMGLLIAVGVGAVFGCANGLLVSKAGLVPFIATYSIDFVALGAAYVVCDGKYIYGFPDSFRALTNGQLIPGLPNIALVTIIIFIVLYVITRMTIFGRGMYSAGFNLEATSLSGIKAERTLILIYIMNGILAGIVGILYLARLNAADPTIRGTLTMDSLASALIGGIPFSGGEGSVFNAMIGALIIVFIRNGLNIMNVSTNWNQAVVGFVILFSLVYEAALKKLYANYAEKHSKAAEA